MRKGNRCHFRGIRFGKSTLLRCINFLEEPTAGRVEVDGIVIDAGKTDKLRTSRIRDIRKRTGMC